MQRCLLTLLVCSNGIAVFSQTLVPQTVAILPFANTSKTGMSSADPATLDWIGESVAETLREAAGARGLASLERDELLDAYRRLKLRERFPLTDASVLKIGESLDAEQVVAGTFEYHRAAPAERPNSIAENGPPVETRGSLRIAARVYDRRRMRQTPEFTESGSLERVPDDDVSTLLLGRCLKKLGFNPAVDARLAALERLKSNYEERAWRQLKSLLDLSTARDGGLPRPVESKSP